MILKTPEEQFAFGEKIASVLKPGDIIAMDGELGAGKTTLTQGIAKGLGIEEPITSPTFTLMIDYAGKIPLAHIDAYRITEPEELIWLGFDDKLDGKHIVVIEWASLIADILPQDYLQIDLHKTNDGRQLTFTNHGRCDLKERIEAL